MPGRDQPWRIRQFTATQTCRPAASRRSTFLAG